ncbi:PSP1 domain protein [Desulfurispirillum indicum S5]|uniref:PSP1 domain protein n=1 Tax=Desulfurispirillum indicum (strain ATCC BAA-1389 / DSM 22839 / S5) TaxID=653733 RepID=E6W0X6_DESIS|nr:PSP1 domain protein [Desulfurispirillum indicum S5]
MKVVSVKFRTAGKLYEFLHNESLELAANDYIIVSLEKGVGIATVVHPPYITDRDKGRVYRRVVRRATEEDVAMHKANLEMEKYAFETALHRIKKHKLPMKLVRVEYLFDATKITFYFTSDGRVDFRELVKDLAQEFKTRIEMRQIGVRDETKLLGGFAPCGRTCCCSTFLRDFAPVSIRMAKEQNLNLSPSKISGLCGRLMCCLVYEHSQYEQALEGMPTIDSEYDDGRIRGTVKKLNPLKRTILVYTHDGKYEEIDLTGKIPKSGAGCSRCHDGKSACMCEHKKAPAIEKAPPADEGDSLAELASLHREKMASLGITEDQASPKIARSQPQEQQPGQEPSAPRSRKRRSGKSSRRSKDRRENKGGERTEQREKKSPTAATGGADSGRNQNFSISRAAPQWKERRSGTVHDHSKGGNSDQK